MLPSEYRALRNVIYLITNSANGKRYVGQTRTTFQTRWLAHRHYATTSKPYGKTHTTMLSRAMRKHGFEAFEFRLVEVCEPDQLNDREAYWIAEYGTMVPNGYNLSAGGNNAPRVPEVGAKIRASMLGKNTGPRSEETKARIRAAMTPEGRERSIAASKAAFTGKKRGPMSEETKAKIRIAATGRRHTEETKAKLSALQAGTVRGPYSEEHRAAIRAGHTPEGLERSRLAALGRVPSEATRQKMSESHAGHEVSDTTRQKLREIQTGKKLPQEVRDTMAAAQRARRQRERLGR
jgi:group I intron endonuclease